MNAGYAVTANTLINWTLGYFGISADVVALTGNVLCINVLGSADVESVRDYLIGFSATNNLRVVQDCSRFVVYS